MKNINSKTFLVLIIMCLTLLAQNQHVSAETNRNITDMLGREVEIPVDVERVIAVGAGALRLVSYLDSVDKVVGVEEIERDKGQPRPYTLAYKTQFRNLPIIGPAHGGEAELITAQEPDVIIKTYTDISEANRLQIQTGIPVVALEYASALSVERDIFAASLEILAEILDQKERAEELIKYTEELVADLKERTVHIPEEQKPRVYLGGLLYRGTHGIVSTDPAYSPFYFVHANNVASELGDQHVMVDREQLLYWDPELIFVDQFSLPLVADDFERTEFQEITAIKEGKIYGLLPVNHYTTNFATELANAYYVGKVLYPDDFADIDPKEKADEIYEMFVGSGVYEKMEDICRGFERINIQELDLNE